MTGSIRSSFTNSSDSDGGIIVPSAQGYFSPQRRPLTPLDQDVAELAEKLSRLSPSPPPAAASAAPRILSQLFSAEPNITEIRFDATEYTRLWEVVEAQAPSPKNFYDRVRCGCVGLEADLQAKCRYPDMLPTNEGLVSLQYTHDPVARFINANWIGNTLATQGPRANTVTDFLIMLVEQKIKVVACLCPHIENGKVKSEPYWNRSYPQNSTVQIVEVRDPEVVLPEVTLRHFKITFRDQEQLVDHFHFEGWPDFGVCDAASLLHLVRTMRAIDNGRMACHCSAGIGRTGVVCALNLLLDRRATTLTDIFNAVIEVRKSRPGSIMNIGQLQLLVEAAILAIS